MCLLAERPIPPTGYQRHDGTEAWASRPPGVQCEDATLTSFRHYLGSGFPLVLHSSSPSELM